MTIEDLDGGGWEVDLGGGRVVRIAEERREVEEDGTERVRWLVTLPNEMRVSRAASKLEREMRGVDPVELDRRRVLRMVVFECRRMAGALSELVRRGREKP